MKDRIFYSISAVLPDGAGAVLDDICSYSASGFYF